MKSRYSLSEISLTLPYPQIDSKPVTRYDFPFPLFPPSSPVLNFGIGRVANYPETLVFCPKNVNYERFKLEPPCLSQEPLDTSQSVLASPCPCLILIEGQPYTRVSDPVFIDQIRHFVL